jgi:hypothetical protein
MVGVIGSGTLISYNPRSLTTATANSSSANARRLSRRGQNVPSPAVRCQSLQGHVDHLLDTRGVNCPSSSRVTIQSERVEDLTARVPTCFPKFLDSHIACTKECSRISGVMDEDRCGDAIPPAASRRLRLGQFDDFPRRPSSTGAHHDMTTQMVCSYVVRPGTRSTAPRSDRGLASLMTGYSIPVRAGEARTSGRSLRESILRLRRRDRNLHHVNDRDATSLLRALPDILKRIRGFFVAAEPVSDRRQRTTARVLAAPDRGRFERSQDACAQVTSSWFDTTISAIRHDMFRFPHTHCIITATV